MENVNVKYATLSSSFHPMWVCVCSAICFPHRVAFSSAERELCQALDSTLFFAHVCPMCWMHIIYCFKIILHLMFKLGTANNSGVWGSSSLVRA